LSRTATPPRQPLLELPAERSAPVAPERSGFWGKLKRGLLMTHTEIADRVGAAVEGRAVLDEATIEHLEEALVGADLGVETAAQLVAVVRQRARRGEETNVERLREILSAEVARLLEEVPPLPPLGPGPAIILVVGVNGAGKTTSIAKLARFEQAAGRRVLLAAADTFRAAAAEQLQLWGQRLGIEVVRQAAGADPAAVVYDAIRAAPARKIERVIVDTAGRLHTKDHLMAELAKIGRVIEREGAGFARRTLLVLDATTGQNALAQAREFAKTVAVDGVILAKLDGTAKGGMVVAVARELKLPVAFLGVGEGAEDLLEFQPREFAAALLS
jgi:fused signal recognition particle receptor